MSDDPRVAFLNRCLDADEAVATACAEFDGCLDWSSPATGVVEIGGGDLDHLLTTPRNPGIHIARHDPASALALVEAHRSMLDIHRPWERHPDCCDGCSGEGLSNAVDWPCPTFGALLGAYRGWWQRRRRTRRAGGEGT